MARKLSYEVVVLCSECLSQLEFDVEQVTENCINVYVKPCESCIDDAIVKYCEHHPEGV